MKRNLVPQPLLPNFMKVTLIQLFLLIMFSGLIFAHDSFGQGVLEQRITLKIEEDEISTVLAKIESIAKVKFMYSPEVIQAGRKVKLDVTNERLERVLQDFLPPLRLTYEVNKRTIILNLAPSRSPLSSQLLQLSERVTNANVTISGTVTDEKGDGLPGVNIILKGTQFGTNTDTKGNYAFNIPDGGGVLVFSFLGYKTVEQEIGNRTTLDVSMSLSDNSLEEVVVVGFGLKNKKETISGAISTVHADELSHASTVTAAGALVGKMPGIAFRQSTGRPGSAPSIEIRNYGSPLVIIDGIQKDYGSFAQLDFNDIENISVLKDASASIYGMQAANGVLVVTTKKGKRNQKPVITLNGYYGLQMPAGYNKPADAATYLKAIIQDETYNNVPESARTVTREEYNKWLQGTEPGYQSFDWFNYIWQTKPQTYGSLNVSGGSDNTDYYISFNRIEQKSMLRNFHGFDRTNFQSNVNINLSKKLKVGLNVTGRLERNRQPGLPGDDYDFALQSAFRNLPTRRPFVNDDSRYPAISAIDPQFSYGWINEDMSGVYKSEVRIMQLNGTGEYNITNNLKARVLLSYWFKNYRTDLREKSPILYKYNDAASAYDIAYQGNARYTERYVQNSEEMTSNVQLDYEKTFQKHHVHLVTGMETKSANYPGVYFLGSPEANGIPFLTTKTVTYMRDEIPFNQNRLGVLGRFNYDYDSKYILELSGRYDGSYFYKKGKRFGFFPSASVAYRVSQENFWKDNAFLSRNIDEVKLRGSYGILGKELGNPLTYLTGYNFNQGSAILDGREVVSSRITGLATDNITWGRVYVLDLGVDVGLLGNRLTGGFDWFDRHQTGELASRYDVLLPEEIGFSLPSENLNSDHTRGIEMNLNWKDNVQNFTYFLGGNFTFSRWITGTRYRPRWANSYDRYRDLWNTEGRFRDGSFQLVADGQFQSWEQIANHPIDQDHYGNTTIRPGDYIFKDTNNDGYITDLDMQNVTYRVNGGTPWLNFAFQAGASWKGIDFRAEFAGGSKFTYEQQWIMRYFDGNTNVSQYLADNSTWYKDIWDKNSGYEIGRYPLLTKGVNNWMNTHWPNSNWQTNVTYLKLRNVELGYNLPDHVIKKVKLTGLRIYISAQNILTFTNMPGGLDPEMTHDAGIAYPNPRLVNAGLTVKF